VVSVAATGLGKTLSFLIPIAMAEENGRKDYLVIIITPLSALGKQNEKLLKAANIQAIAVDGKNSSEQVYKVRFLCSHV
jgi:superfamily II DNA helicase RecQ